MRISYIIKKLGGIFEKKKKNPIHLANDSNLESNLKPLKVSNKNTPIQISEDTVDVKGNLKVNGESVQTGTDLTGGGTQYWHQIVSGYRLNNTSTSSYYTFYRNWYELWSNADSSPTTISYLDASSSFFIAPRAGTITNIKIQGYARDTGATDPVKFYFYKSSLSNDASSMSLSAMFNTSAITPPTVNETFSHTEDFSSSNDFDEDDNLFVWMKKDSNSGNQDLYFTINVSGEYS